MNERWVSVAALRKVCDPTECWPWSGPAEDHWERIARFAEEGWKDPIGIDVGVPGYASPAWMIHDGNHRFYAAILRGDTHIWAYMSGSDDYANEILKPTEPW